MAASTESGPASYEKLALELINKPEDFLRYCLPSLTGDKITDLGISLACEKYVADHGYTVLDFVRAVDLLQGYILADVDLFEDVDEDKNVTHPTLPVVSKISVKPPPGNYKITRLDARTLDNEKKADLGSVSIAFDKSNIDRRILRMRKGGSFEEGDTITCEFSDLGADGVWHLKSKGNFAPSLDFAFAVEPLDETNNRTTFKGTVDGFLIGASSDTGSSVPSVVVEGVLEPPQALTSMFEWLECLVELCCCCCEALAPDEQPAADNDQGDNPDQGENPDQGDNPMVGPPTGPPAGPVAGQRRQGHRLDENNVENQADPDTRTTKKKKKLKRKNKSKGIGVSIRKRRDDKGPDKDDGMGGNQDGERIKTIGNAASNYVREKKSSKEAREKRTGSQQGNTKVRGMLSPELESSLINGKFNTFLEYPRLMWMDLVGNMASKASQLLLDTLPQIDPVSGKLKEVTHGIEWDSVIKSQVKQVSDTATQPTPVEVLQRRFIDGLHASAMSYVQTALSNEFVALDKIRHPLAKDLVPFWDAASAIHDSLRLAIKSPPVMEGISNNACQILAEEQAKHTSHPVPYPTTTTALELQQNIREAAAKSQSQLLAYVDGLNEAERAGALKLDESANAIASSLRLSKTKADAFAPLAQPSNWPGVPTWLLLLNAGGAGQSGATKLPDTKNLTINNYAINWQKVPSDKLGMGSVSIEIQKAAAPAA